MEWLKDKKNLPIVVAIAVFVILAAGGFSAYTLGLFPSSSQAAAPTTPPAPLPLSQVPGAPPPPGPPGAPGMPVGLVSSPGKSAAVPKKTDVLNPAVGPDPFYISGGLKRLASNQSAAGAAAAPKPRVRDLIGPFDLFQIRPPTPPAPPAIPGDVANQGQDANYRLAGIITGSDGINAILENGGQTQSVKPGDSLPDGTKVQNIQATSITLRTTGGTVISLPLSAGTPNQGGNTPYGQPTYQPGFGGPGFGGPGFGGPGFNNGPPQFNQQGRDN